MDEGTVRVELDADNPRIAVVTVDRPPVNAMTPEQYERIAVAFEGLHDNAEIGCIVFTGSGSKAFIGGADLRQLGSRTPQSTAQRARTSRRAFQAVRNAPVPVICALNGSAMGAGLVFAACCDIVVAARGIKLGLPELNVGVPGGISHLNHMLPDRVAKYLVFTGQHVPPEFLMQFGAIQEVVEAGRLMPRALELAALVAARDPAMLRMSKESTLLTRSMDVDEGYRVQQLFTALATSHKESLKAAGDFFDKPDGA